MEFVVATALKPSLRRELVFQQTLGEELFYLNANTVVGGEDFSVDDLLDLSNGESLHHEQQDNGEEKENSSLSSHSLSENSNSNSTDASYDSIFSTELLVPVSLFLFLILFLLRFSKASFVNEIEINFYFLYRMVTWQNWSGFLTL